MFEYAEITTVEEMAEKRGVYRIDHELYHSGPGVSSSELKKVLKSPQHALVPVEDTPALAFGRAFHMAILEPDLFATSYIKGPDYGDVSGSTKEGRAIKKAWQEEHGDFTGEIMKDVQYNDLEAMVAAVKKSKYWDRIKDYDVEIGAFVDDERTGLLKKCKADMMGDLIIDFKSTQDAAPGPFTRTMYGDYGYVVSAAYYQDIFYEATGARLPFVHCAVEKKAPYSVAWYQVPEAALEEGRKTYRRALEVWSDCKTRDVWPGYPDEIITLEPPAWFFKEQ